MNYYRCRIQTGLEVVMQRITYIYQNLPCLTFSTQAVKRLCPNRGKVLMTTCSHLCPLLRPRQVKMRATVQKTCDASLAA